MSVKVKFKIGEKKGITANYTVNNNNPIRTIFKINAASASFYSLTGSPYDNDNLKDALNAKADITALDADVEIINQTINDNYNTLDGKIDSINGALSDSITAIDSTIGGYGDIVTYNADDFATSIQGGLADTALQPNDNISLLNNNAGFITNAVNDLINYYLKSETYTKLEVQQLIASIPKFAILVVQELPVTGQPMTLYLVPKDGEAPDVYNEYIWVEDEEKFELLGSTAVDLTGYAKESWVLSQGYITLSALNGYATETYVNNGLATKQNTLTAGDNITINGDTISAVDTTYTAGTGISIENGVISNTQTSAEWGNIDGDIADQTDLAELLDGKQDLLTSDNAGTDIEIVNGAGGDDTVSGNGSVELEDAVDDGLNSVTLTGRCEQTATPSPTNPIPIVSNNGQLKASANLFDQSLFNTDAGITVTYYTFTIENGTYTMSTNIPYASGSLANVFLFAGQVTTGANSGTNGVTINTPRTITVTNGKYTVAYRSRVSAGDTAYNPKNYNWMLARSSSAQSYQPYVEGGLYTDGVTETITDSANNSATAEMLLGIGDYTDTQEILTGDVTRKIHTVILDGSEDWVKYRANNGYSCFRLANGFGILSQERFAVCTHFDYYNISTSSLDRVCCTFGSNRTTFYLTLVDEDMTLDNFKAWLSAQCSSGTPVIVVFAKETETTETVTGQTLTTVQGDNTLTISQASIENLPIEANYNLQGGTVINFVNDSGFITNTVNNLTNYYLKTETYTKLEVQQLIASIPQFSVEVVQTLPVTGERMVLYLVPKDGTAPDVYDEYIWVEDEEEFELIGSTAVDLTDYVTNSDLATALADYALTTDIPTDNSELTNGAGYITGINQADVIDALGYTPYNATNPNGYITSSALNDYATETYVNNGLATKQDLLTADNGGTDIAISTGGVGDDVTVSGNGSVLLEDAEADSLNSVTLTGGCEQTATPSPSTPVDITTNNGNITVSPNLFRTLGTTTTQGGVTFTPQADGSVICSGRATAYYSYYLGRADFDPSTIDKITVAINGTFNASGNIVVDKFHVYSGSTSLGTISYTTWTQSLTVDIANDYPTADNIRVYIKRNSNTDTNATIRPMAVKGTTNKAWKPYGQITITGTVETVTDEDGNTATAENLLAVGNYADTQELITGAVNRQLAILVLTGTESWSGNSSNSYFSLAKSAISPNPIATSYAPLCTHLVGANSYESVAGTIYFGASYLNVNYNNEGGGSSSSARANFNNWLKTQFANGTPVIVVYPLDTETTETVTGQTLTTIDGDNTLTISQASINNLPISANYTQKAGMTINFTNETGYITGINSGDVTTALGYTPVNPTSLATVATSGSYNDLSNKPTIPTKTSDLTNDSDYVTETYVADNFQKVETVELAVDFTEAVQNANLGSTNRWTALAYGANKFLSIGRDGYVSTSNNGTNWTTAVQNSNLGANGWMDVIYDGEKFVSIGQLGYISTSTDGITWATASQIANLGERGWCGINYYNNKYVALSYDGYVSTSTDGTTWTSASLVSNLGANNWTALTYGNKYVAISYDGHISTSTDGTTWTSAVANANLGDNYWTSITYDGTQYIALGRYGHISTSTDGTTWTNATYISNIGENNWYSILYHNSALYLTGTTGYVSTSASGTVLNNIQNDNLIVQFEGGNSYNLIDNTGIIPDERISTGIARIADIPSGVIVDQTYDGTSTNAQSGVAIAGELADYVTTTQLESYEFISADALDGYVTTSDLQSDYYTSSTIDTMFGDYTPTQSLATVALTGDYDDLLNTPSGVTVDQTYDSTSSNPQSGVAIAGELSTNYQAKLVSGTNIRTVGGISLLGSGNIAILGNTASGTNSLGISNRTTSSNYSTYFGYNSYSHSLGGSAFGYDAKVETSSTGGTAIGQRAVSSANYAIQIGNGTNSTASSLNIGFGYDANANDIVYQLLDGTTGLIPDARLSTNIARTSDVANINLSNLSATGQTVLDGQWVSTSLDVKVNYTLAAGASESWTLNLPNDNYNYEVMGTITANGTSLGVGIRSNIISTSVCRAVTIGGQSSTFTIPIGTDHKIGLSNINANNTATINYLRIFAYRRIGTNS